MARLKTRMRRKRRRDGETSVLLKGGRADWMNDWQRQMKAWDQIGFVVSALCIVHCVATPVVFALFPTLRPLFGGVNLHAWLAGSAVFITFAAFLPSCLQHRRTGVLALAGSGLSLLVITAVGDGCCRPSAVDRTPTSTLVSAEVGVRATEAIPPDLALASSWNRWATTLGGALLAIAHVLNTRFRRCFCHRGEAHYKYNATASGKRARRLEPLAGVLG